MAQVSHASLTGSALHEPKGIEAAAAGEIYVADGVGSGVWGKLVSSSFPAGSLVNRSYFNTNAVVTAASFIPLDDTVPQSTEGTQVLTIVHTPKQTGNKLFIQVSGRFVATGSTQIITALFKDSDSSAISAGVLTQYSEGVNSQSFVVLSHEMTSVSTAPIVFKVRCGSSSGHTVYMNGNSSGTRFLGGSQFSSIEVLEYKG